MGTATSKKDRGKGALIGAAAGARWEVASGITMDKQESELRHKLEARGSCGQKRGSDQPGHAG